MLYICPKRSILVVLNHNFACIPPSLGPRALSPTIDLPTPWLVHHLGAGPHTSPTLHTPSLPIIHSSTGPNTPPTFSHSPTTNQYILPLGPSSHVAPLAAAVHQLLPGSPHLQPHQGTGGQVNNQLPARKLVMGLDKLYFLVTNRLASWVLQ